MRRMLPVIVALIVGLAIGWLLPRATGDGPPGPANVSDSKDGPGVRLAAELPTDTAEPDKSPSVTDTAVPAPSVPAGPAMPDFAAMLRGEGELAGTAHFADGAPAVGVALIASPSQGGWFQSDTETRRALRAAMDAHAVVDAEGAFVFRGLMNADYYVSCTSPLFEAAQADSHAYDYNRGINASFRPGDPVRLTIHPRGQLRVNVLMPDGSQCTAARVVARGTRGGGSALWTPLEPYVVSTPGTVAVTATAVQDDTLRGTAYGEITPGSESDVTVQLALAPGLHVAIKAPHPWYARVQFLLHPALAFNGRDATRGVRPQSISAARQGALSRYYKDIEPGDYVLAAWNDEGYRLIASAPLTYTGGAEQQAAVFEALPAEQHVLVRVVDAEGKPRLDARVSVWVRSPAGVTRPLDLRIQYSDGVNWYLPPDNVAADWTVYALASVAGVGRAEKTFSPAFGQVQELRLAVGGKVAVNVADIQPGAEKYLAALLYFEGSSRPMRIGGSVTEYAGGHTEHEPRILPRMVFEDVPLGRCEVVILYAPENGGGDGIELLRHTATVTTGSNEIDLRAPRLAGLTLTLPADTPPGDFYMRNRSGVQQGQRTDTAVSWPLVTDGEYAVRLDTQGEMKVLVRGETRMAWAPLPFNAIAIRSLTPASAIATGLQRNDVIIRIDDQAHEGDTALRAAFNVARKAATVRLEVLRGDATIVVEVEGAKLDAAVRGLHYQFVRN